MGLEIGKRFRDRHGFELIAWHVVDLATGDMVAEVRSMIDTERGKTEATARSHEFREYVSLMGDGRVGERWFRLRKKLGRWIPGLPYLADLLVTLRMAGAVPVVRIEGRQGLVDAQAELLQQQAEAQGKPFPSSWEAEKAAEKVVPRFRETEWPEWVAPIEVADGHEPETEAA
jgi:hypothetical protein